MKKIRKAIALILVATLFACMFGAVMNAGAVTFFGFELPDKSESDLVKWLVYTSDANGVVCVYVPGGTVKLEEGDVTITNDTPIAIDHNFLYWEDEYGNIYESGQTYHVTKLDTLYAVWEEKDDGEGHVMHTIKSTLEALSRLLSWLFGFYEFEESFSVSYSESKAAEEALTA